MKSAIRKGFGVTAAPANWSNKSFMNKLTQLNKLNSLCK